jgi:hypothetical protein
MERPILLHNMSAPPGATISHQAPASDRRLMVFRLPDGEWSPATVLARLDRKAWAGTSDEAERELRRRLDRHAATLPYPGAALVGGRPQDATKYNGDFLTTCAILAKSSARVYLRDKEPNLGNLQGGRVLLLQLPGEAADHA